MARETVITIWRPLQEPREDPTPARPLVAPDAVFLAETADLAEVDVRVAVLADSAEFSPDGIDRPTGRPGGAEKTALGEAVDGVRTGADGVRGFLARKREFQVLGGGLNRIVHDGAESSPNRPG